MTLIRAETHDSDADGIGMVNANDLRSVTDCLASPETDLHDVECGGLDAECDGDVDLSDFSAFQNDRG